MRTSTSTRPMDRAYRPHVLPLEDRLPLGEGVLGVLVGASLLPAALRDPGLQPGSPSDRLQAHLTVPGHDAAFTLDLHGEDAPNPPAAARTTSEEAHPHAVVDTGSRDRTAHRAHGPEAAPPALGLIAVVASPDSSTPAVPSPAVLALRSDDALLIRLAGMRTALAPAADTVTPTQEARVKEHFGKLPLTFEQNVGQTDASVHFFTRGPGYGLFLTATEAVMVLEQQSAVSNQQSATDEAFSQRAPSASEATAAIVRMQFVGANATPTVTGRDQQPGKINYFLGNDPAKWHTNISTFGKVEYDEVYPGIDLVYYGNQRQLEYDFVVSPGADPNAIRLAIQGAERVEIDAAGDLVLHAGGQEVRQHKPFVYQEVGGVRREVASRFVLHEPASGVASAPRGYEVRFTVAAYDVAQPLVIDPVLSYSTYLGGSNSDLGYAIAVDPATGEALVTGNTGSVDFPTFKPLQPNLRGVRDAFVARLAADGSALVFSTYLGGTGNDFGDSLAVDPLTGDILVSGDTGSTNFPTVNPLQGSNRGGFDTFVTRLNAAGSALLYSTYLGGSGSDNSDDLAVDPVTGDILLTGNTASTNFPTVNALQPDPGGNTDVFLTRLNAAGTELIWSTYLGGSNGDAGRSLDLDPETGDVLLTGRTASANFPTVKPLQPDYGGGLSDAFVTRVRADGSALIYSTYLGGGGSDFGNALAVDPFTGEVVVAGETRSLNFPTADPFQPEIGGITDLFVARLNVAGSALVWSTYLGGSLSELWPALAVDPVTGEIVIAGGTESTDFPLLNPLQKIYGGNVSDAFVTRLNAAGSALVFSTYLGGSGADAAGYAGSALAVDPATGDALLTGWTESEDFPTANAIQPEIRGGSTCFGRPCTDPFVTRIGS